MTKFKRIAVLAIALVMLFSACSMLVACHGDEIDNETTRLVIASSELDGVFNPFFSSSGPDNTIIGMTQLSMISANEKGELSYGAEEACAVLDYYEEVTGSGNDKRTTYYFVLKNDLKFSNGSPLTMKDVLFNLYVYLDPAYTGSSTIYSTDIVGLADYRTQTRSASAQDRFDEDYEGYGWDRLVLLADAIKEAYDANGGVATDKQVEAKLDELVEMYKGFAEEEPDPEQKEFWIKQTHMLDDYIKAKELFRQELEEDYRLSKGTAEDIKFDNDTVHLNTDVEAFLYNEGFIRWNEGKNGQPKGLQYSVDKTAINSWTEEQAIQYVYDSYVLQQSITSGGMYTVVYRSKTTDTLWAEFTAAEKKLYFDSLGASDRVGNVSGIEFANRTASVTFDGKTYAKPEYNSDGSVKNGNEVLKITIKDVDPKAIWNFGFAIAPMYYYSNQEQIQLFDYESHFGVDFGNPDFMSKVVKATEKTGVPVGAGPYKATTRTGDSSSVTGASFKENNVVYFERNEHFMFPVQIKYVNYQVVAEKQMLDSLFNGAVHFAEPACKQENIALLDQRAKDGFGYNDVMTNGYGYIGINAEKVPNLYVRQAIMHAIDTSLCLDYYYGYASAIYRPMTRASWAYPKGTDQDGQYYKFDETGVTSENLVKDPEKGGYTKNADGIYAKGKDDVLEYTFTIAGDSEDHPAYKAMQRAATILNAHGFKIKVQKDINALKKLNTGDLAVWAAAWGSGIDPDMYQVYHIDSLAGSTANWGYRAIRRDKGKSKYKFEYDQVLALSEVIDKARQTLDQDERKSLYADALKMVMDLAVELPTYQRSDLFAYNTKYIDANTLVHGDELTSFNGPLARIWEVSFNK